MPEEAVLRIRVPSDAGRLLALKFIATSEEVVAADCKSRDFFISEELSEWLA